MSLQGLISGSECAAPANPLSQVLKHTEGDRSLQQDRIAGPSTSRLQQLPGTISNPGLQQTDHALASQFFGGASRPNLNPSFGAPPQLPLAELARLQQGAGPSGSLSAAWNGAIAQSSRPMMRNDSGSWSSEFGGMALSQPGVQQSFVSQPTQSSNTTPMPIYSSMPMPMHSMGSGFMMAPPALQQDVKGKGKAAMSQADFESAFADATASFATQSTDASRFAELDADGKGLEEAQDSARLEPMATEGNTETGRWEAELSEMMNRYREDGEYDYGKDLQEAWEGGMGNLNADVVDESVSFDDQGLPVLEPYRFEPNNKLLGQSPSSRSFLQDAKNLLESGGSLGEVGLLLEAAIQRGELGEGGYESWLLLGETKSMDEREESAMQAFSEGVRIAQANSGSGAGMLSLAISFTNEGYERASYSMLLHWLRSRFPDHPIPTETMQSTTKSAWHSQPLITDAYLDLARSQHAQGVVDADVQIALGVLFYSRSDYDHAKDCFQSALALRPDDFRLWNRYGSCLSNGNQPEESLSAYQEALRLRPTYTRAVYNVAVACMNIGANKEAAEHLLDALSSQSDGAGTTSEQLWTTLKRTFNNMDRPDLADLANGHPPVDVFRKEGFEFSAPKGGLPPPTNPSAYENAL